MRAAICISGQLRGFEQTFPALSQFFLKPFACDVFISTWEDIGLPGAAPETLEAARKLYQPVKMEAESWTSVRQQWGDMSFYEQRSRSDAKAESTVAMWYKVWRANELKSQAEREGGFIYDVVIRSRSDVLYFESPEIDKVYPNYIYLGNQFGYGGFPDLFAFGPSGCMDAYSNLFANIPKYVSEGCLLHAEMLLMCHLLQVMPQGVLFSRAPMRVHRSGPESPPFAFGARK